MDKRITRLEAKIKELKESGTVPEDRILWLEQKLDEAKKIDRIDHEWTMYVVRTGILALILALGLCLFFAGLILIQ